MTDVIHLLSEVCGLPAFPPDPLFPPWVVFWRETTTADACEMMGTRTRKVENFMLADQMTSRSQERMTKIAKRGMS